MTLKTKWHAGVIFLLTIISCSSITSGCRGSKAMASRSNEYSINKNSPKISNASETYPQCSKSSCNRNSSSHSTDMTDLKALIPSCTLSNKEMTERKAFLQATTAKKIVKVKELETGYELIFHESIEYSKELLEFINFERGCCSNFSFALIFGPNNKATHLQVYGSKQIKEEVKNGLIELGFLKNQNK